MALFMVLFAMAARADDHAIRYDDIESFLSTQSPLVEVIDQKLAAFQAERDAGLMWTNPRLSFGLENSELASELEAILGKRFVRPLSRGSLRRGWDERSRAAELRGAQEYRSLVSATKAEYLRLKLLDEHLARLARLARLIDRAEAAAVSRFGEGQLAGNAKNLIQLTALSIRATLLELQGERSAGEAEWRARMGFDSDQPVDLATPVGFRNINLRTAEEYLAMLGENPLLMAGKHDAEGLDLLSRAFRPSPIPAIELYGGYKNFDAEISGIVAGISLDLPIFDRGAPESRRLEAARLIAASELGFLKVRSRNEVKHLVAQIRLAMPPLEDLSSRFDEDRRLAEGLLAAYREGSISLDAYLNSLQIIMSSLSEYYDDLMIYYTNVLRLETLTGANILVLDE